MLFLGKVFKSDPDCYREKSQPFSGRVTHRLACAVDAEKSCLEKTYSASAFALMFNLNHILWREAE